MAENLFSLMPAELPRQEMLLLQQRCNTLSARHGLLLGEAQMQALARGRVQALRDTRRVEFGPGILPQLVEAFCDSPYLTQATWEETLLELQELFYYYKGEAMERLDDEELIAFMRRHFDTDCQGSLEYLGGTSLEDLCRRMRAGESGAEPEDDPWQDEDQPCDQ